MIVRQGGGEEIAFWAKRLVSSSYSALAISMTEKTKFL